MWGDSIGSAVVEGLTKNILAKMDEEEALEQDKLESDQRVSNYGHHNPAYHDTEM